MRTLRARFILSHILPILILVPLTAVALIYLLETQVLLDDLSEQLSQQAYLIATAADADNTVWQDPLHAESFVSEIGKGVTARVILFRATGDVLASTGEPVGAQWDMATPDASALLVTGQQVAMYYSLTSQVVVVTVPAVNLNNELVGMVQVSQGLEGVANRYGRLHWYIFGVLAVELLVGVFAGLILALRLERPIGATTNAVFDIASGQRIEPIPEQGPQEIRLLIQSVNNLYERLTLLEETRRRLLANLVHELGRPLGALRAAIHTLLQGADDDPDVRHELLSGVEFELKRMEPLLDDLAQLHGQVLGNLDLDRQLVDVAKWLPPLLVPWRAAAWEKGLRWHTDIPDSLPLVSIDGDRLARALGNLVSNAIKYTPADEEVTVSAGADEQEIWIRVADTGPGIIPEEQDRVFEPFYRGQQQTRFPKGLGLGLTIAHDLVVAHGGRLELKPGSGHDGSAGAEFTIYLPRNEGPLSTG